MIINFLTADNRILNYIISSHDGIYIWPYNNPLEPEFIDILERKNAPGIELKPSFNYSISQLPASIKIIRFPYNSDFNQPVDNLPAVLEHLELYDKFNQPLDCLPQGLKRLIINASFNHPLENLPSGLEYLEIRGEFNHPLDNLPLGLKELRIKNVSDYSDYHTRHCILRADNGYFTKFNLPIKTLPPNLEVLELSHKLFNRDNIEANSNALDPITLGCNIFDKYRNFKIRII